ncbi:MAG TPA: YncE family protein [Candidatus Binatus sp.]|nr:YncE family protein [Candidatus Binatus sp.]
MFTSNRGEKTVGIFSHVHEEKLEKVAVGGYPNGLAFDPLRGHLLAANVSRQDDPAPITASIIDAGARNLAADIIVPGRTRWTVFDKKSSQFYVNISKPAQIIAIDSVNPDGIATSYDIPATGPHGLDLDSSGRRLFCACDEGGLFTIDLESKKVSRAASLSGTPDVIFYNDKRRHLYVAIGDLGVIDVFDTATMRLIETVKTGQGAHTIAYNSETSKVYSFLPESHRAGVYLDE